ncbi:hypothetical protein EJ04DRAFT_561544 [Polyplosphaeria fusca]|uniref:Uncharacterized protein n=1 Tax=Polyplosphaeria fusca TaxID=682080 RepID=A0A9P4R600_9PLEO|nr:hypothetical protein EJ04DRAFT_561544 [Polyplosphaeria fusca]
MANVFDPSDTPYEPATRYRPNNAIGCSVSLTSDAKDWKKLHSFEDIEVIDSDTETTTIRVGDFINLRMEGVRAGDPALLVQIKKPEKDGEETYLLVAWVYEAKDMDQNCVAELADTGKRYILSTHFQIVHVDAFHVIRGPKFLGNIVMDQVYDPCVKAHRIRPLGGRGCVLWDALDARNDDDDDDEEAEDEEEEDEEEEDEEEENEEAEDQEAEDQQAEAEEPEGVSIVPDAEASYELLENDEQGPGSEMLMTDTLDQNHNHHSSSGRFDHAGGLPSASSCYTDSALENKTIKIGDEKVYNGGENAYEEGLEGGGGGRLLPAAVQWILAPGLIDLYTIPQR